VSECTRPLLRWHGGKWILAPWIMSHFPPHRVYVEPFGGAFSVGLRKPRTYAEVWNDLDDELVNLFGVLRSPEASDFVGRLRLTPFARTEFEAAYEKTDDPVERARRLVIRSFMGHGSDGASGVYRTGFRGNSNRSGTTPAHDWAGYADALEFLVDRIRGVVIENRPALDVMHKYDGVDTLHYVDPPYPKITRTRANRRPDNGGVYRHELTAEEHGKLLGSLCELKGMVALSSYPNELYDALLSGWRKIEKDAKADGALDRVEVLWLNPALVAATESGPLFRVAAVA
jgi:DNA adenine methylase